MHMLQRTCHMNMRKQTCHVPIVQTTDHVMRDRNSFFFALLTEINKMERGRQNFMFQCIYNDENIVLAEA